MSREMTDEVRAVRNAAAVDYEQGVFLPPLTKAMGEYLFDQWSRELTRGLSEAINHGQDEEIAEWLNTVEYFAAWWQQLRRSEPF